MELSNDLVDAENFLRENSFKNSIKKYLEVAKQFEALNDYETASYFHNRCLEISKDFKYLEGQANAYKGLGICEEKVLNIMQAMKYLETAQEKAIDANKNNIEKDISQELVRVYQIIAIDF